MEKTEIVLMAYGTPKKKEDIPYYLKEIMHGREVSQSLIDEITYRYEKIGFSPLKDTTSKQAEMLEKELNRRGVQAKVHIGMKHWKPSIKQAVDEIDTDKNSTVIGLVAHPFSSVAGSGEYKKILKEYSKGRTLFIDRWYDYEELYDAWKEKAVMRIKEFNGEDFRTIFSSHGLPSSIKDGEYRKELAYFSERLAGKLGLKDYCLAYQNGGHKDWYKPDVKDEIKRENKNILLIPIGYISESLETLYDIDIEYAGMAERLGINFKRVGCIGKSDLVIKAIASAVMDKIKSNK